jgi:hypothetical protein
MDGSIVTEKLPNAFAGYSEEPRPLGSYAALVAAFNLVVAATIAGAARRGRLPERVRAGDIALLGIATHKLSRLIAKDAVTAPLRAPFTHYERGAGMNEVEESPRGTGPQRALAELLSCPPCSGQWVAAGFLGGLLHFPRATRAIASLFAMQAASDFLHLGFKAARDGA